MIEAGILQGWLQLVKRRLLPIAESGSNVKTAGSPILAFWFRLGLFNSQYIAL